MSKSMLATGLLLSLSVIACTSEPEVSGTQSATTPDGAQTPTRGRVETQAPPAAVKIPKAVEAPAPEGSKAPKTMGPWADGDTIASGQPGVPDIQILEVHANGEGPVCGDGKSATLRYKAMKKDGKVLDPGTRPFTFRVGQGRAIKGWDVIVSKMRVGDSFTLIIPERLAYGAAEGDLKFDMELLSFK